MKEKNFQHRTLYLVKILFRNEWEVKAFWDEGNLTIWANKLAQQGCRRQGKHIIQLCLW
jgi:hypothetical protein